MGLVAVFIILTNDWYNEKQLTNEVYLSGMALIYFIFFGLNTPLYLALT